MPNYHPYNQYKGDFDGILNHLGADIICVQETKITRKQVPRKLAILEGYDSFLSCYRRHPPKGYSGTAIFTKRKVCVPVKAEEGLSGVLQQDDPKIPKAAYVDGHLSEAHCAELNLSTTELRDLDCEGRTTIVDLGLFVLISIYSPNLTNEARGSFKDHFNLLTEARVRALIDAGRQVIVAGDLNICSQEIDHADPYKNLPKDGSTKFTDTRPRQWLNALIGENGCLVDVCRYFNPNKLGWETRIDARSSNYGTRIDYILVTPDLLPWIKTSKTLPQVKGSDHCPVYVEFYDSITTKDGKTLSLREKINPPDCSPVTPSEPPLFAGKSWPEFAHKLLSTFFGSISQNSTASSSPQPSTSQPPEQSTSANADATSTNGGSLPPAPTSQADNEASSSKTTLEESEDEVIVTRRGSPPKDMLVRKQATAKTAPKSSSTARMKGKLKSNDEQKTIASFFVPPKPEKKSSKKRSSPPAGSRNGSELKSKKSKKQSRSSEEELLDDVDEEEQRQLEAAIREGSMAIGNSPGTSKAWSDMFRKQDAPLCKGHQEPCKELTTTKPGPNKGRMFWLCARPKGPNDDQSGQYQCDHFEFSTRVTRPYLVGGDSRNKK